MLLVEDCSEAWSGGILQVFLRPISMNHLNVSRRRFLKGAGLAASATLLSPLIAPSRLFGANAPSNQVNIGMIGMGRQMMGPNLSQFLRTPGCQVVAVCDVDAWRLEQGLNAVNQFYADRKDSGNWKGCKAYKDWRDVIADKNVDAVFISTPDHWHGPMMIAAMRAGKDISCEKPITRYINEGRIMADLAAEKKLVFRVDSEFRSIAEFHRAAELVRNGVIGKVLRVHAGSPKEGFPKEQAVEAQVPEGLDYDMWLGPAPEVKYMQKRVHAPRDLNSRPGWMRNLDYCDGMVTNWGTHLNDIGMWGANVERTGPVEIKASGKFHDDPVWNVLETFTAHYRFENGLEMVYEMGTPHTRFEGENGWIQVDHGAPSKITASSPDLLNAPIPATGTHFPLRSEKADFIECVRNRTQTLEDAEVGHRVTSLCHLAHIAAKLGGEAGATLAWDPAKEVFLNNDAANKLLVRPPMRGPWTL